MRRDSYRSSNIAAAWGEKYLIAIRYQRIRMSFIYNDLCRHQKPDAKHQLSQALSLAQNELPALIVGMGTVGMEFPELHRNN